jgi:cytochrome c-type biogenesis protein CcmH/NrfG
MILSFWIYALLLCVLAVAFVLLPVLYRGREGRIAQQRDDRAELNRVERQFDRR